MVVLESIYVLSSVVLLIYIVVMLINTIYDTLIDRPGKRRKAKA